MKKLLFACLVVLFMLSILGCKKDGVVLLTTALRDNPKTTKGAFKWVKNVNRGQVVSVLENKDDGEWMKVELPDGETKGWIQGRFVHVGDKQIISFTERTKLYDQPDSNSRVKSEMPSGTKAIVLKEKGDWYKVSASWRLKGWIRKGSFEKDASVKSQAIHEVYISGIGKCNVEASSTLSDSGGYSYSVKNLFDHKGSTTWQEGEKGDGVGEWVEVSFPSSTSVSITMINGMVQKDKKFARYGADGDLYLLNNRVKTMRVDFWDAGGVKHTSSVNFEDDYRDFQDAGLYYDIDKIRFTIDAVYDGLKWDDTSIGDIRIVRSQ